MKNTDIRQAANAAGIRLWQIAESIGLNDGNFSRKLRHELPDAEKQEILDAIDRLSKERDA